MKRPLFTILAALSLLVFVAVVVLWVRSHFVGDKIQWRQVKLDSTSFQLNDWYLHTINGDLIFFRTASPVVPFNRPLSQPEADQLLGKSAGFWHWRTDPDRFYSRMDGERRIPLWTLIPACLLIQVLYWRRLRIDAKKAGRMSCQECGYDLRATPDRCPECGTPPAAVSVEERLT